MPASAEKALEGMLAEGTDASAIIEALKGSGFNIKPPEGDESYDEAPAEMGIGLMIEGPAPEPEGAEPKDEKPEAEGGDQKPMSLFQRREKAARSAMKKHGYPTESDDDKDE